MKASLSLILPATCIVLAGLACAKPQPILPRKPVAADTALFQFTRPVVGPIDLTIDGNRVAVEKISRKKCRHLEVSGLAKGRHRLVLLSPLEAFGPDQIELELDGTQGQFMVLFAQEINSVLYGKPEPMPAATGIPGVKARLQP